MPRDNRKAFTDWIAQVDKIVKSRTFFEIGLSDLSDWDSWSAWNDGLSPAEGAEMALEDDDLAQIFLEGGW